MLNTNLLEGRSVSDKIKEQIYAETQDLNKKYNTEITLAVVLVGDNPASQAYVKNKEKACLKSGIKSVTYQLPAEITQAALEKTVLNLVKDKMVHGILVQLPLPKQIDPNAVLKLIPSEKDVDGLTDLNISYLAQNKAGIVPCTAQGVVDLLNYYNIPIEGQNITIIGRSVLAGKPLAFLLTNLNATVTLCHSKTKNLANITKQADIVICAVGAAKFLKKDMVTENSIVIDVGINKTDMGLCGDADFENLVDYVKAITPVPGSCGLCTVSALMKNVVRCFKLQQQ